MAVLELPLALLVDDASAGDADLSRLGDRAWTASGTWADIFRRLLNGGAVERRNGRPEVLPRFFRGGATGALAQEGPNLQKRSRRDAAFTRQNVCFSKTLLEIEGELRHSKIWDYDRGKRLAPHGRRFWGQLLPLHRHKGLGKQKRAKRNFLAVLAFLGVAELAHRMEGNLGATWRSRTGALYRPRYFQR